MCNPLHASHYADEALKETVSIIENVQIATDTYRLRFEAPQLARRFSPGQFVMMRPGGGTDPLVGRAFAVYDTIQSSDGEPTGLDIVYMLRGKMTRMTATLPAGTPMDVWGPLGNGFEPLPADVMIAVGGGVGLTPFLTLAREYLGDRQFGSPARTPAVASKFYFLYGAASSDRLTDLSEFEKIGATVHIATDDGSAGHHGLVTDLLAKVLTETTDAGTRRVGCCGPEPMMEAVAKMTIAAGVPCQVSLETPMACGVGICSSCVCKVRDATAEEGWDYKRSCVDGPVFDADKIVW